MLFITPAPTFAARILIEKLSAETYPHLNLFVHDVMARDINLVIPPTLIINKRKYQFVVYTFCMLKLDLLSTSDRILVDNKSNFKFKK